MNTLINVWAFATAWYNIPFTLALLAFLGLSALQFVGLDQDHDTDVDHDLDLDHDLDIDHDLDLDHDFDIDHDLDLDHDLDIDHDFDIDHDLDLDHDMDVDHDLDLDHDADLDHDLDHDIGHDIGHDVGGAPAWAEGLRFLGVGQAPLTMVLLVLLGGFGIFGWVLNALILGIAPQYPSGWLSGLAFVGVLVVDMFIGAMFTSRAARFIGRAVPAFASTATSIKRLVSRRGRVTSPQVDEHYGQVKVRDPGGTLITVFAVVDHGQSPIPRDAEVILVEYDETRKVFIVVPSDL